MQLNKTDIKILFLLSQNSRRTISSISKLLSLSNDSIKKRIVKLENSELIKAYKVNINFNLLNFKEFDLYFKLKNYSQNDLNKIIDFLRNCKYITWIGTTFGKYDLRLSIVVKSSFEVSEFIESFKLTFKGYLINYLILEILEKYKIPQEKIYSNLFDVEKSFFNNLSNYSKNNEKIKFQNSISFSQNQTLSNSDKKIISVLNLKPNNSLVNISNKINLTPESVKYTIEQLKNKDIVKSFSIILDTTKLNKIWSVFLFKLDLDNSKKFLFFLKNQKNISAFVKLLGSWDYSVTVFADNIEEIHRILMDFRNNFPDLILDYEMLLLFETYKYPILPEVILQ